MLRRPLDAPAREPVGENTSLDLFIGGLSEEREQRIAHEREASMQFAHADSDGLEDEAAMQAALESLGLEASQVQTVRRGGPSARNRRGGSQSPSLPSDAPADEAGASEPAPAASAEFIQPVRRSGPKVGRNDPCPCGSGKKYKQCHGRI